MSGKCAGVASADSSTVVGRYDATGRLTRFQPAGGLSTMMGNSAAGRPTLFLPPAAGNDTSAESATYDADGLPATIRRLDGQSVHLTYDAAGRPAGWTVAGGVTTVAYDPTTGLEINIDRSGRGYDGVCLRRQHTGRTGLDRSGRGSVVESLDANGRVSADTIDGASGDTWGYDGAGSLTGIDGLALTRDPATGLVTGSKLGVVGRRELRTTSTSWSAPRRRPLERSCWTTGTRGTPSGDSLDHRKDAIGTTITGYTYDGSDRLASVTVDGKLMERDTYDAAGDRTSTTPRPAQRVGGLRARDRLQTGWPNLHLDGEWDAGFDRQSSGFDGVRLRRAGQSALG